MRILVDTNILFSALLWPNSKPSFVLWDIINHHELVFCTQTLDEIREVISKKEPSHINALESFLAELSYELIPAVSPTQNVIRDETDQPIINAAIIYDVDLIITGDKDFLSLDIKRPKCLTAAQYQTMYMF